MNRREFIVAAGSLPLLLAACGSDDEADPSAQRGPWTFTDDRGERVTLDAPPERIVAHEYALAALWDYGVRPVGTYGSVPMAEQPLFDDLDLGGVKSVGEVWGEVNLEALAALRPDVIISTYWPSEKLLGGIKDDKLAGKMSAIAPLLGIHAPVPATTTIEHFEKLAGALGHDIDAPAMRATRKRYDDAVAAFRAAVEAKPDLRMMAVYADPEAFYVAKTADYSDLREYAAWGLDVVSGESSDPYWEKLSWENADKYEADLILHDARAHAPSLDDLAKIPVWSRFPAVEASQLSPWHMEEAVSYRIFAAHVEELTAAIERAEVVT
jgi:iron complex transport system substrate-binding protein